MRVYEQRRLPFLSVSPLETTDLSDLLEYEAPESVSHWVEVRLLDHNGEPRAGEHYRVVLGDDTELEGDLNQEGVARIPDLPEGPCQWFFPSLQPGEWARA